MIESGVKGLMTCVIGYKTDNGVYIGGDTLASNGYLNTIRQDGKVFERGEFLIGFSGSYRVGQLLRYKLNVPEQPSDMDDYEYMVTFFIDSVRELFAENGVMGKDDNDTDKGGLFLVAYHRELYSVDYDFQVGIPAYGYDAIGSGAEVALGAMYVLNDFGLEPEEKISRAILAASELTPFVGGDITIYKQEYNEELDKFFQLAKIAKSMDDEDLRMSKDYLIDLDNIRKKEKE